MKKIVLFITFVTYVLNADVTNSFDYKNNETLRIRISKDSVNRVVLPNEITGKIYSQEKNINIQTNGSEAYVKVIPKKKMEVVDKKIIESEIIYADNEVEVFFLTDKKTYAVIFVPDKIDPRTVYITDSSLAKEDVVKIEKGEAEYIKNIKNIFRLAIENRLDNSFDIVKKNERHDDFLFLSRFDGMNYQVYKFFLKNNDDAGMEKANKIVKNKIAATALFEHNYFVLAEKEAVNGR